MPDGFTVPLPPERDTLPADVSMGSLKVTVMLPSTGAGVPAAGDTSVTTGLTVSALKAVSNRFSMDSRVIVPADELTPEPS